MKKLDHLEKIALFYDTFVIDLWGVMHDGIKLYPNATKAVDHLISMKKKIVFLSNAPRPSLKVVNFLKKMKMKDDLLKNVITSGEAAMIAVSKNTYGKKFYHLGPKRDDSIYEKVKENKTNLESCDYILCTGLFDEYENNLEFYHNLLKKFSSKKMICTNPDLIVHRGKKEEYCAGKIAEVFESLGGKVIYFGKPHEEVYKMCFDKKEKVLAIGDNLRTDIKGANNLGIDSLFIYHGVHRDEIKNENDILKVIKNYKVFINYFQFELNW